MNFFAPLTLHSNYSLLMGVNSPKDIAKSCAEKGYKAAALTDYMSIAGCVEFFSECKKLDIKPILGCHFKDIYVLAKNLNGWYSLMEAISEYYNSDNPNTKEIANRHFNNGNHICFSISETFDLIYPEKYSYVNFGKEVFYVDKKDAKLQRILLCSKIKKTLPQVYKDIEEGKDFEYKNFFVSDDYYIPDTSPEEVHISIELANECEEYDILKKPQLPHFNTPEGKTEFEYLTELCRIGWKEKLVKKGIVNNPEDKKIYAERVKEELSVIEDADLSGYFLIVQDIVNYGNKKGWLMGPGRGCFLPDSLVKMYDGSHKPISMIKIGDRVIDAFGQVQRVYNTLEYEVDEELIELEFENGKIIRCTKDHEFLTNNRGWVEAKDLTEEDDIKEV